MTTETEFRTAPDAPTGRRTSRPSIPEAAFKAGVRTLRVDINSGSSVAPNFDHAVRLMHWVNDFLLSSETGKKKSAAEWHAR